MQPESPERDYIAIIPTRGYQTVTVKARTAKEARRKINEGDPTVDSVDHNVDWSGRAQDVRLDRAR